MPQRPTDPLVNLEIERERERELEAKAAQYAAAHDGAPGRQPGLIRRVLGGLHGSRPRDD